MAAGAAGQATIRTQGHLEPGLVPGHGAEEGVQGAQCLNAHCLEKNFQNFVHWTGKIWAENLRCLQLAEVPALDLYLIIILNSRTEEPQKEKFDCETSKHLD